jgi:hypothetical protein
MHCSYKGQHQAELQAQVCAALLVRLLLLLLLPLLLLSCVPCSPMQQPVNTAISAKGFALSAKLCLGLTMRFQISARATTPNTSSVPALTLRNKIQQQVVTIVWYPQKQRSVSEPPQQTPQRASTHLEQEASSRVLHMHVVSTKTKKRHDRRKQLPAYAADNACVHTLLDDCLLLLEAALLWLQKQLQLFFTCIPQVRPTPLTCQ